MVRAFRRAALAGPPVPRAQQPDPTGLPRPGRYGCTPWDRTRVRASEEDGEAVVSLLPMFAPAAVGCRPGWRACPVGCASGLPRSPAWMARRGTRSPPRGPSPAGLGRRVLASGRDRGGVARGTRVQGPEPAFQPSPARTGRPALAVRLAKRVRHLRSGTRRLRRAHGSREPRRLGAHRGRPGPILSRPAHEP